MKTLDGKEQENSYDGEGLRAGITENGKKTTFLYHNGEILTEFDGESAPIKRYLRGIGLSHVQTQDNEAYHAYYQDEQGSIAFITGQGRETENIYQYDAFGNLLEKHEDVSNRILYTGQQYDQETGQYYLRARYYNPVVGRFLQEDTYRGDGLNLYAYCANNPVVYYDPSGHVKVAYGDNGLPIQDGTPANIVDVELSKDKYPESAKHIEDAIASGQPEVLTIDRSGAKRNRRSALKGQDKVPDMDLDEYPPAMSQEGGSGASVRGIPKSDNRGSGASLGNQLRDYPNGTKYRIKITGKKED